MHTVIRTYTGSPGMVDELTKRQKDVETIIRDTAGFIAYYLIRTDDGMVSITVCETKAGTDETTRKAAEWIRTNLPQFAAKAPQVTEGDLAFRFYDSKVKTSA